MSQRTLSRRQHRPSDPPLSPSRRIAPALLVALGALTHASPAAGQSATGVTDETGLRPDQTADEWEQGRFSAERFEARVRLFGTSYENYFRAPDDEPATQVSSLSIEGRVTFTLHRERRVKAYFQAIREEFEGADILPSPTFATGLRIDGDRHRLELVSRYQKDRELLDIDDNAEPSDIYTYSAAYSLRFAHDWEWEIEGELRDQRFGSALRARDSELAAGATSIRYRGFGRRFSPEVGIEQRTRDAVDPHDDYDEQLTWVKLRFSPLDALTMSVRFRDRRRDYRVGDPDDSNFGRHDARDEWTLRADWLVARRLALNLEAERLDTRSTRTGKSFSADQIRFGATVRIGPMEQRRAPLSNEPPPPSAPSIDRRAPQAAREAPTTSPTAAPRADDAGAESAPAGSASVAPAEPPAAAEAGRPAEPSGPQIPEPPAANPVPEHDPRPHLVSVYPIPGADGLTIVVLTAGPHRVSTLSLRDPERLVLDLHGLLCAGACGVRELADGPVLRIRSAQFAAQPTPVLRVVLDLRAGAPAPTIGERADQVLVQFAGPDGPSRKSKELP